MGWMSIWWVWIVIAAGLGTLEVLAPGFIALGFALGALGVAALLGLGAPLSVGLTALIFAALSLIAWIVLRQLFKLPTGQTKTFQGDINDP